MEKPYILGKDFLYECFYQIQEAIKRWQHRMNMKKLNEMKRLNKYLFDNTKDQKLKFELREIDKYIENFSHILKMHLSRRLL